jgi:hypothetical protein
MMDFLEFPEQSNNTNKPILFVEHLLGHDVDINTILNHHYSCFKTWPKTSI